LNTVSSVSAKFGLATLDDNDGAKTSMWILRHMMNCFPFGYGDVLSW
jgi:hypothetical protein